MTIQSPSVAKPSRMQWMKLSLRTRTDPVVQLLSFDDQRHLIWLMMLDMEGVLNEEYATEKIRDAVVAKALGLTVETALEVRARLVELRLINELWITCGQVVDEKNGDTCDASHSVSHVTLSQRHTTSAERTRAYRARKKLAKLQALSKSDSHGDTGVTSLPVTCDALELEQEQNNTLTTGAPNSVDKSEKQLENEPAEKSKPPDKPSQGSSVEKRITAVLDVFLQRGCVQERLELPDSRMLIRTWLSHNLTVGKLEAALADVLPDEVAAMKCADPIRTINTVLYQTLTGRHFDAAEEKRLRLRSAPKRELATAS